MLRSKTVADIMVRELVTLNEEDNLEGVAEAMDFFKYRYFPVVDGKRLVGLVTHRNLLRATSRGSLAPSSADPSGQSWQEQTFVGAVMTTEVPTIAPDATVADAAKILLEEGIPCLPVVDAAQELVGLLTRTDVLKLTVDMLNASKGE